jgi:hypothetical protein
MSVHWLSSGVKIFTWGTIITLALAALAFVSGHKLLAAAIILISPFPCPSGVPC